MYILINFTPDEFEINVPPIIHNIKNNIVEFEVFVSEIPELLRLLKILIHISVMFVFSK